MIRLRICAFGALVITCTAAIAQDVDTPPDTPNPVTAFATEPEATSGVFATDAAIRLGQDKAAPACPTFCAPRRVTSPELATVGEREVLTLTLATAAASSKLHVDGSRSARIQMEKLPSAVSDVQMPTVATRNDFRPALDPVLAQPTTEPPE